jgi:hypothetical protein
MSTGCNSKFEGEIVTKLFDAAADSILEFINIPINVIKFIMDAAIALFSHMGDACDTLDCRVARFVHLLIACNSQT